MICGSFNLYTNVKLTEICGRFRQTVILNLIEKTFIVYQTTKPKEQLRILLLAPSKT